MDYVLVFAKKSDSEEFIVVEKQKPDFQKGRFNLPGGKIEPGEGEMDAALRELNEETGFTPTGIFLYGILVGSWGKVFCFLANLPDGEIKPRDGEIERFFWSDFRTIKYDDRLLPNLKIIIPLMLSGLRDWTILDEGCSTFGLKHQFAVAV